MFLSRHLRPINAKLAFRPAAHRSTHASRAGPAGAAAATEAGPLTPIPDGPIASRPGLLVRQRSVVLP